MSIDLSLYDDQQLDELIVLAIKERDRRDVVRDASSKATEMNFAVLRAEGINQGDEWRQPTGAHDAYPLDWQVTYNGKLWESLAPANVWVPGESAWKEIVTSADTYPVWLQPTGAHDAYNTGDRVRFEGNNWESKIDGNTWSPTDYPAGWTDLGQA